MAHVDEPQENAPQEAAIETLVADYQKRGFSRRAFIQRSLALGLSLSAASALLAACGSTSSASNIPTNNTKTLTLLTTWGGEEQDSFKAVVAPFTQSSGITVNITATRDVNAQLTILLRGNNPPDIAILPNPGKMQELAAQHHLLAFNSFMDMSQVQNDYASSWIDLGSYNGKLYAIFFKAANKGTVWYNPAQFQSNNYTIPTSWQDMITLSINIASSGKYPWSMGVESGAASGWPSADWVAQIFANQAGPDQYDKWVKHTIPWTDASVKNAFQYFGQIAHGNHYINGAPQSILATNFQPASFLPFETPPKAYMFYLGDFTEGFITTQFPQAKPETDFNFFPFPTVNDQYKGAITVGADVVVAMRDGDSIHQLVKYLATADAQAIWVKRGGFTAVNKNVPVSDYPDAVAQASVKMLTAAPIVKYGAGDLMPAQVQTAFWQGLLKYIQDASQLDSVLSTIESTAVSAYH
jgi:alpha-glucoside transport system substrate-binding protein